MQQLDQVAYVPQASQIDCNYPATVWDVVMMGRVKKQVGCVVFPQLVAK
jgi:manganese/iron transport system ATP-binding protein